MTSSSAKIISVLAAAALLAGCQTTTPAFCELDRPISWSKQDTRLTIREIKGHNAAYKANCP